MFHVHTSHAKLFLGLALAGLIASANAGSARANDRQTDSIHVGARDLDLRTRTGQATLRHRVLAAAYRICDEQVQSPMDTDAFNECVRDTVQRTSTQVRTLIAAAQGPQLAAAAGPSR